MTEVGNAVAETIHAPTADVGAAFAVLLARWRRDRRPLIMGILNATPDSFSDGGHLDDDDVVIAAGQTMRSEGAAILDIGGESTRPDAEPVPADEEWRRIAVPLRTLSAEGLVSVDTHKASVAETALSAGAQIVNDVRGLQGDPDMAAVCAAHGAGVVAMHNPALLGSRSGVEGDPVAACLAFFERTLARAAQAGIAEDRIVLDPGLGFGKTPAQNCALLARLDELAALGPPILVGSSRKSFIGTITGRNVSDRLAGTIATNVAAVLRGAAIVRVHDVAPHHDAMQVASAILAQERRT